MPEKRLKIWKRLAELKLQQVWSRMVLDFTNRSIQFCLNLIEACSNRSEVHFDGLLVNHRASWQASYEVARGWPTRSPGQQSRTHHWFDRGVELNSDELARGEDRALAPVGTLARSSVL
jgi:hypothetical protein